MLVAVALAVLLVVPSATGRKVEITGKLHAEDGENVDKNSSISMTVVVRGGKPRKLKNVSVTYTAACDVGGELETRTAKATFAETIDINWKPGVQSDRVDFRHRERFPDSDDAGNTRDGERFIQGDVTKRGRRATGQIFLTFDNYLCGNVLDHYSAPLRRGDPPRGK